jgi:hypothetical protein
MGSQTPLGTNEINHSLWRRVAAKPLLESKPLLLLPQDKRRRGRGEVLGEGGQFKGGMQAGETGTTTLATRFAQNTPPAFQTSIEAAWIGATDTAFWEKRVESSEAQLGPLAQNAIPTIAFGQGLSQIERKRRRSSLPSPLNAQSDLFSLQDLDPRLPDLIRAIANLQQRPFAQA